MSPRPEGGARAALGAAALALVVATGACTRNKSATATGATDAGDGGGHPTAATSAQATAVAPSPTSRPAIDAAAELRQIAEVPPEITAMKPASGKSIGHTSVVFKLETEAHAKFVFKPASKRGPTRYRGEIAAYRLSKLLGLDNVSRAYPWSVARADLMEALGAGTPGATLCEAECIVEDDRIAGALLPWVDPLSFMPLETEPLSSAWKSWLVADGGIPSETISPNDQIHVTDPRKLAPQVSTLVAFDFLTGNWDRWSGGNIGWLDPDQRLLFIDNDGAFFEKPPAVGLERNRRLLDGVQRFSKSFADRLRALDDAKIESAFGEQGLPLPEAVRAQLRARRDELLAHIAKGETPFP